MRAISLKKALNAWNSIQPISKKDRDRLSRRFTIDYNYNSNHIEGNTLTYGQTEILLLFGKIIGEAYMKDVQDMTASNIALQMMTEKSLSKDEPLTQNFIRILHKTILRKDYEVYRSLPRGSQTKYTIHAGCYKTRPNSVITRYGEHFDYASPEETPALMSDLVDWYNETEQSERYTPIQLAALFHYRFIRIHPFEDGNGRIARLMVNYILAKHGYPMIVIRSRKKHEYLEALHHADLNVGRIPSDGAHAELINIEPFLQYFTDLVAYELYKDFEFVTCHDENIWWYDGEKIKFRTPNYAKILRFMRTHSVVTIQELQEITGINTSAIKKLLTQLIEKKYVEKNQADGSWNVFINPSI